MAGPRRRSWRALWRRTAATMLAFALIGALQPSMGCSPAPGARAEARTPEVLRAVAEIDCAPYACADADGEVRGLCGELLDELAGRLQVDPNLQLVSRAEAERRVRAGEADVFLCAEIVPGDGGLIASVPFAEDRCAVYGRERIDAVVDLCGRRTGALRPFEALGLGDDIERFDDCGGMFERLAAGELDFAICPTRMGDAWLRRLSIRGVRRQFTVAHAYGAIVVSVDRAELLARINAALKALGDEGRLAKLNARWDGGTARTGIAAAVASRPAFALALLLGLLALVVLAALVIAAQRRSAVERADYTRRLQRDLEIIRDARVKAYRDELTGVRNKNAYQDLEADLQRRIDAGTQPPFAIVMCDLNGLKDVNDESGHQAGDDYLREACGLICRVYAHSPVFRIGGDEFVVVLTGGDYERRERRLMEIRHRVLANQARGGAIIATGMAEGDGCASVREVFECADRRMYENKATLKGARI